VAVDVDLEMEMAADGDRVAGLADRADSLAGPDALPAMDERGAWHVGVEVAAVLPFAVDQQVVAVQDRVVARAQHLAAPHRNQWRAAGRDDVEPFVPAPPTPRRPEFPNRPPRPVRAVDREDVIVEPGATVGLSPCGRSKEGEQDER